MRFLSTAILLVVITFGSVCLASDDQPELHPVLGKKPPREVLNKDILNLTQEEGSAWVHGAVAQMATVLARIDVATARCVRDWYFEDGDGAKVLPNVMKQFPDTAATATIATLASRACPKLQNITG
ncbi:MAG: hypothetical protein AAGC95_11830 [Pseudomonadota bacterium]